MTTPDTIEEANETIKKLRLALEDIGAWDCQGDSLRVAYDSVYGKGKWDELFEETP